MPVILAIESSCDETSASVCVDGAILSNIIANQTIHEAYGGVVPELASRVHQQNIVPAVQQALFNAKVSKNDVDAVAFTRGPGLLGSLLVGVSFAKSFALAKNIPLIEVNHMQAHVLAHFIGDNKPAFPFLCLTVSGGHTQIVLVKDYFDMEVIGQTLDDAAGEAMDKTSKILGLPYPGGPLIDKYARQGNADAYKFPEPQIPGFDFSFSGLKTSILYFIRDNVAINPDFIQQNINDICASVEKRIATILLHKLEKAADAYGIKDIALAGGVSANTGLRQGLLALGEKKGWRCFIPAMQYCTDNAAMIAIAGYHKYLKGEFTGQDVAPLARMPF
ncbi:tRNA (adenosine(37)-N6)-threonylcarbamoyltransferase complex transferase subunit TsaD [Mucilaginibacter sp. L3T2-6]|uniref:tRNA (adenosine(37)-N6)-threonylcarbamoyltransferase complex transferase subunit TsaD n=1 Tax=Mucilaginibacter sp. L3T2-6 TaxID=3062491 RepID=UPI002674DC19|nr:tRNA (adenosine(37)-N6)-threonylcarbamoyltransferase complex transferase subunit TsaD [Mucilaginibacter sp. L3T2-6]MDO3641224.1 tRNA (adenosine(37)-N6)-threonylcarbamoyltransferase complex transferase subunit TsaD [Mucilaginibacter sp. L3T2-6]MDV6214017.1 tRNA (adenosine(37)-N6)-threonylcarbamoyltransferase complex transferase subunit TsaD [Mucilaginibacter sp. L3T2-6]